MWWYEGDTQYVIMFLVCYSMYCQSSDSRTEVRLQKCWQTRQKHPPCFQESKSKLWLFQENPVALSAVVNQQMRKARVSSVCSEAAE